MYNAACTQSYANVEEPVVASAKINKAFALLFHSSWSQCRACKGIDFYHAVNGLYAYHINTTMQACTSLYLLANWLILLSWIKWKRYDLTEDTVIEKNEDEWKSG